MISRLAAILLYCHLSACAGVAAITVVAMSEAPADYGSAVAMSEPGVDSTAAVDGEKARMIELNEFTPEAIEGFVKKIKEMDAEGRAELWIKINSNGGSVYGGMALIQQVEMLKTPVTCVVDFRAMSMGMVFLQSGACDRRLMTKRSHMMAHEASSGGDGNADGLRDTAQALDAITSSMVVLMADRMQMSEEDMWAKIRNRAWFLDYHEALKYHAVDGLADAKDFPELVSFEIPSSKFFFFGN